MPLKYRVAARLAGLALVAVALWALYSWIWDRGAAHVQAEWDLAVTQAELDSLNSAREQQTAVAAIDQAHTEALKEKDHEIARLRAAVAAGSVRLRVNATCPGLPAAAGDPGVDTGPAPELGRAAVQDYFVLRDGINRQYEQLTACQSILRGLVGH